jgi:hypothetical protein
MKREQDQRRCSFVRFLGTKVLFASALRFAKRHHRDPPFDLFTSQLSRIISRQIEGSFLLTEKSQTE